MSLIILMFAEIALFIFIGTKMGVLYTLLLIITTSFIGGYIVKKYGLHAFKQIQQNVVAGNAPGSSIIEGALLVVGALLLLVPGFISDIIALSVIVPATRKLYLGPIYSVLRKKMKTDRVIIYDKRS